MSETPAPYTVATSVVTLMQCPVAGFQYHSGEAVWSRLRPGEELRLKREPGNRHDPRAIRIHWRDVMLGYIPREANYALSQLMDQGASVKARIESRREGAAPWDRLMVEVLWTPGQPGPHCIPEPGREAVVTPHLLVRSLANRVFGPAASAGQCGWVEEHLQALALAGVEHPALLPFLRLVAENWKFGSEDDPLAALQRMMLAMGLEPAAWKRLPRWTFEAFASLPEASRRPASVVWIANLLLRLDLYQPPPGNFARHAMFLAEYRHQHEDPRLDFERYPLWFMRGLLKGVERAGEASWKEEFADDVRCCADWLIDVRPSPDTNQQKAGWVWMLAQAVGYRKWCQLALATPWPLPVGEMTFGPWWVVPMKSPADLAAEAAAMKNCLEEYAGDCRSGNLVIFSIRDALTSERTACFAVSRDDRDEPWELEQVAAKMNEPASVEACTVAALVVERMNRLPRL